MTLAAIGTRLARFHGIDVSSGVAQCHIQTGYSKTSGAGQLAHQLGHFATGLVIRVAIETTGWSG